MLVEVIFSGFVSKVVNDIIDVSKDKIRRAVRNRNTKHQTIESQIYNIVVDVLNKITENRYKSNQDRVYDAAEVLLKSFKENDEDKLESIKSCLRVLDSPGDEKECLEFKGALYEELGKDEYSELFRVILLLLLDQKSRYDNAINVQLNQKLDEVILILRQKGNDDKSNNISQKVRSRTQEYADKWDANMFLNDFDKRDENAGVNVKLSDVYLDEHLPHYIWKENEKESNDLKDLLSEYVTPKMDNNMLLILGQPGIGKSTLITWITANFTNRINDIFVYKFADDLADINWQNISGNHNIAYDILMELGFSYDELNGKTLIIDGFDEISIQNRMVILNKLFWQLIKESPLNNFSLIITCRENYIQDLHKSNFDYIALRSWDMEQIESFCSIFQKNTKNKISESTIEKTIENKDVFGIPLILYMVLALNISIDKEGSIVDVYDKIFSLDGGIYDRCINNKSFAEPHRIGEVKKQIHQISRDIAIWMFENNPEEASIPQEEYKKICINVMREGEQENEDITHDFIIGGFFKLVRHCEGIETEELYFVHRTIYEYFVVETIYSSIENAMKKLSEESQEELAGNIAVYLKQGEIDYTIGEYLRYKILKLYNNFDVEKQGQFYPWWEKSIEKMMKMGMFYYAKKTTNYANIFAKEIQCFNNLIEILRLIFDTNRGHYILEDADQVLLMRYIKYSLVEYRILYLDSMESDKIAQVCGVYVLDLSKLNLARANLRGADLVRANLARANLKGADLAGANLAIANLKGADLRGANLTRADLRGANLIQPIFDEKQIAYLEEEYELNGTRVYIEETEEIISYEEYCRRKS